jgi:branched-chain amino acid transport system substrate-binding protein
MKKLAFTLLLLLALVLSACGTDAAETDEPAPTTPPEPTAVPPTEAPEPTEEPTEEGPPDLTGDTITIYHFGDISGPYAAITGPLVNGSNDMVAHINSTGGIFGATVELSFADTGGSVDEAVAAYDRFTGTDDNILLFLMYGSPEEEALYQRLAEDQIPVIAAGLSAVAFYGIPDSYVFGGGPIYPDQLGYFLDYITANWAAVKPASAGDDIMLAYLSWPGAYGEGALTDESRAYAASLGVEIVHEELYDLSPAADTTTAILNAQAAGANVIYTNTLAFGPANLLNDLNALGVRGEFLVGGNNWAMDVGTYAFLADPAFGAGFYAPFPFAWWNDVDNPAIQFAEENFAANERTAGEHNIGRLLIQAFIDVAKFAIENAILEVGFENLTGQAVYDQLVQISGYDALGGLVTVDYTNGRRSPSMMQMRVDQGGPSNFNVVQDWTEAPDLRP